MRQVLEEHEAWTWPKSWHYFMQSLQCRLWRRHKNEILCSLQVCPVCGSVPNKGEYRCTWGVSISWNQQENTKASSDCEPVCAFEELVKETSCVQTDNSWGSGRWQNINHPKLCVWFKKQPPVTNNWSRPSNQACKATKRQRVHPKTVGHSRSRAFSEFTSVLLLLSWCDPVSLRLYESVQFRKHQDLVEQTH